MGTNQFAALLGITRQRVNELAREGVIPKSGRGLFDPSTAIPAYCAWLRDAPDRRGGDAELKAEKVRLTREQADKAALENERLRGALIPAEEVERVWTAILANLRANLLAVPARVSSRAALPRETVQILDAEVRAALETLADD
jgi:phage terminase Nu1 subunit (DNA packaging protein)